MASALQLRIERDARFASDVSHELRSPLMTLSASVEVIEARRHEMPERAQAALDLLTSDVSRFQGLVEDLLEISRFDAGAIRLHLEDLRVAEFVRQRRRRQPAPHTPVTRPSGPSGAVIHGDRRRLARVIANLIDNARAYGGGEPEVTISEGDARTSRVTHVRIGVEDHGPGVPVEERALIFERFARGATAGRRSGSEGAGLGLALVDEHVRMHGGRVWVEDRLDGEPGARFVIELLTVEVVTARGGRRAVRRASLAAAVVVLARGVRDPARLRSRGTSRPTTACRSSRSRPMRGRPQGRTPRLPRHRRGRRRGGHAASRPPRRRPAVPKAVLDELFKGPSAGRVRRRLPTPPSTRSRSNCGATRRGGTLNVDVSPEILRTAAADAGARRRPDRVHVQRARRRQPSPAQGRRRAAGVARRSRRTADRRR